ncbi:MAG: AAA family ATPase, partial [Thiohalomonadales bacterium]
MTSLDLGSLMGKLNPTCRVALENAAGLCVSKNHYEVEIEHWLLKLIENKDSELLAILQKYNVDINILKTDLYKALLRLNSGNSKPPTLSPGIIDLSKESWLLASVDYGYSQSTSTHILCALIGHDNLRRQALESSSEFKKITAESLAGYAKLIIGKTPESNSGKVNYPSETSGTDIKAPTNTPALDKYTINLTERADQNQIDPVFGRDQEVRQIIDILARRRQNNPILTGEAGVGKTAVVEELALRIAANDVPAPLQGVSIRTLDLGLLQAGASIKGEFENRLKSVISEVKSSERAIILFIDEAHSLIGAGGKEGQGDAANLLKPA